MTPNVTKTDHKSFSVPHNPYLIMMIKASTGSPIETQGSYINENWSKFDPAAKCIRY